MSKLSASVSYVFSVAPDDKDQDHNRAVEAEELERWKGQPEIALGYYRVPRQAGQLYRELFSGQGGTITTWLGTEIGTIVQYRVYPHNFGGRMIAIAVAGSNGVHYHGRASYDGGSCVWLRKGKG